MAVNYFLRLDGITGESTDAQHKGQLEILSWTWGAGNSVSPNGASSGKANFSNFTLILAMDSAIPTLFRDLAAGTHIATATLSCVKTVAASPFTFLTFNLTGVSIASLQLAASSDAPSVNLSLSYSSIQMQYTTQSASGAPGNPVTAGWDITRNASV